MPRLERSTGAGKVVKSGGHGQGQTHTRAASASKIELSKRCRSSAQVSSRLARPGPIPRSFFYGPFMDRPFMELAVMSGTPGRCLAFWLLAH